MINNIIRLLTIGEADKAWATAKAINRKCPPYMFKENWR